MGAEVGVGVWVRGRAGGSGASVGGAGAGCGWLCWPWAAGAEATVARASVRSVAREERVTEVIEKGGERGGSWCVCRACVVHVPGRQALGGAG
jgi:hypothetical protein